MSPSPRGFFASAAVEDVLGKKVLRSERFGRHLPYISAYRDDVILTRQGDLMASVVLDGIDSFTSADPAIDELSESFARIVSQLGETFGYYVNKISRPDRMALPSMDNTPFAEAVDAAWQASVNRRALKQRSIMLTLLVRPSIADRMPMLRLHRTRDFERDCALRITELEEAINLISGMYAGAGFRRLTVSSGEWLSLLVAVQGQNYEKIIAQPGDLLAEATTNFDATFQQKRMVLDDGMTQRFGAIFGMKSYPSQTWPTMLDSLELPYDIVITNSFTPRRVNETVEKIQRTYRQRGASEDAGVSLTEQLSEAADEVASGRATFGDHQVSVQVFCDDEAELEKAASEVWRAGQETGAVLVRETWAAKAVYFSQAPGNWSYRTRDGLISSNNFAELAAFHKARRGRSAAESPWGVNITAFPTVSSTLHRFNFHEAGSTDEEPSRGHSMILGRTGSGKTIMTAFLMAQAQRANARLIVFDKDQGLEMVVRALGGAYSEIKIGAPTGFNPMATETDARGQAWLTDWLNDILSRDRPLSTVQTSALNEAVRQIVRVDAELRTFDGLASLVSSTDDEKDLKSRVLEWAGSGRYSWLFSEPAERDIAIGEGVLGLDMTELLDHDAERSALLAYLFRRIERVIEDRRPTMIIIDEAWKMLADEVFVRRLRDWLVTMRKKNCAVVMLTHTPSDLKNSSVGQIIVENVATRVFFPNAEATPDDFKIMRLNPRETEFVTTTTGGQRLALLKSAEDSVFINADLAGLGGLVTVLGGGRAGEERAPYGWRHNPDFWKEMM